MDVIVEIKRVLTICYIIAIKILYCKKGCFVHVLNKILICCDDTCSNRNRKKREKRKQRLKNMTKNEGTKLEEKFTFNKKER